jgi:regulatory protein
MKITSITRQQKRVDRYSIFVDGDYAFSLSEAALLTSGVARGQELSQEELGELQKTSGDDKLYNKTTRYAAMRLHTSWEISEYLKRQQASPTLATEILNKLSNIGLIDDAKYAQSYVHDRQLLRPTSRRKIMFELQRKHVAKEIIEAVLEGSTQSDQSALHALIERKRQQTRYQDDLKLMQYLARQGFQYGDIKEALKP